ncbi:uracil-DNA glycosylase [Terriglobus roseus DSM 18391]|uniref:Type-5 uracil-DNA glycosylase n=1 Tax=Terriglobus roseus (strain DSM 18391 / NRRL B-41598 / KBS 63) TaxID=926566 RepID=I3ZEJ0_TERRK|nr:uracil-DNA glycosylase [Terriglobus roseus]AFL87658.1 uracil-DNA glycosylase [Terriglobus roseus DSM 18391]
MPSARKTHTATELANVSANIVACTRCPRLREYCTALGETKRRAYLDWDYWTLPVPGFGDINARVLIVGLAPGAHGANRTGRPFTGDGAGYFMYPVLYETGFSNQPDATDRDDGLKLRYARIASICRCAPPGDKPTPQEIRNCAPHLAAEIAALPRLRVVVALGRIAFDGYLNFLIAQGIIDSRRHYAFTHGAEHRLPNGMVLLASYHPSLRNTNTGRLNKAMFTKIFVRARELAGLS